MAPKPSQLVPVAGQYNGKHLKGLAEENVRVVVCRINEPTNKFNKGSEAQTVSKDRTQKLEIELKYDRSNPLCPDVSDLHTTSSAGFDPLADSSLSSGKTNAKATYEGKFSEWN